jgi:hypothetical protein
MENPLRISPSRALLAPGPRRGRHPSNSEPKIGNNPLVTVHGIARNRFRPNARRPRGSVGHFRTNSVQCPTPRDTPAHLWPQAGRYLTTEESRGYELGQSVARSGQECQRAGGRLRHSCASYVAAGGASLLAVADTLGRNSRALVQFEVFLGQLFKDPSQTRDLR